MKPSDALLVVAQFEGSYNRDVSDTAREVWKAVLADVEYDAAVRALNELAAEPGYPPTPQQIRSRTFEAAFEVPSFGEVWSELTEAASTCDFFDPNPPEHLSPVANALARQLGWAEFRVSDPGSTHYVHQATRRYEDIVETATRRVKQGQPAFEAPGGRELPEGYGALVGPIGNDE